MNFSSHALQASLAFVLATVSNGTWATQSKIVGGQNAAANAAPWMVGIQAASDQGSMPFCGASLIASNWVMTAAHCVEDVNANRPRLVALVGAYRLSANDGERIAIKRVIVNPNYDAAETDADIALLELTRAVNTATVAAANRNQMAQIPVGTDLTVRGWGVTRDGGFDQPNVLREVQVPLVNQNNCDAQLGGVSNNMLCAGLPRGGKDSCQGDSGGPLTIRLSGRDVQVGIVSWGDGCARPNRPGVYTRVAQFKDWIAGYIGNPSPPSSTPQPTSEPRPTPQATSNPQPSTEPRPTPPSNQTGLSINKVLRFGPVPINREAYDFLIVVNESSKPARVPAARLMGSQAFEIDDRDCRKAVLRANDYCFIDVFFNPSAKRKYKGRVKLGQLSAKLRGKGAGRANFAGQSSQSGWDSGFDSWDFDDALFSWFSSGDDGWYRDGNDLVSDQFGAEDDSLLLELTGAGDLYFDWESSDTAGLECIVDGARHAVMNKSGTDHVRISLPAGEHKIQWLSQKPQNGSAQVRIRNVRFEGEKTTTTASTSANQTGGSFSWIMLALGGLLALRRSRRLGQA